MKIMSNILADQSSKESTLGFINTLEEFHNHSVAVLEKPYEVHLQVRDHNNDVDKVGRDGRLIITHGEM